MFECIISSIIISTLILIISTLILFSRYIEKKWINPLTIFCVLWDFIVILGGLKLFGMYNYSNRTFIIILIGVLGFFLGYILAKRYRFVFNKEAIEHRKEATYEYRKLIVIILVIASIVVYAAMSVAVLSLLMKGYSTATIRESYRPNSVSAKFDALTVIYGSKLVRMIEMYIARPVMYISMAIFCIEVVKERKLSLLSILCLVDVGLYTFCNFGRITILILMIDLLVCYSLIGKAISKKQAKKMRKYVIAIVVAIVILLIYLSSKRWEDENFNFLQSVYGYFAIPVPLLSHWTEIVDSQNVSTYGMSFFQGLFAIVLTIIGRFGVTNKVYDLASLYNYEYVEQFLKIFPNQRYNAFVSMFFAFYLDFRYFGVFIGSFMFGLLISYSYKFAKKGNLLSMSYFLLMMQALVKSFVRWEFVVGPYCFAFIIIRFCLKNKDNKIKV